MHKSFRAAIAVSVAVLSLTAVTASRANAQSPILPSQDPFSRIHCWMALQ